MRVLAVNQFYAPDISATSQLLTQLCEDLARGGADVTVLASRGGYLGGGKLAAHEQRSGVRVVRPWSSSLGKATIAHRLADYLSFWTTSIATLAAERKPEVVLALTTPPMIAAGAAAVCVARRIPLVTWVQDVYPEVAAAFGVLSERHPGYRLLAAAAAATHRVARFTVALSPAMAARLRQQGQRAERIRVIENWADGQAIRPVPHALNRLRSEQGWQGRFVVMYSGNLGVGHDVATLLGAARRLASRVPRILFAFVGQGARRAEAVALAQGLDNVSFLPYQPADRLAESLSAADVHLSSLRSGLEGLLVPSKLYGVLAAGRPLFHVGPPGCELSRVIREHDIGWTGEPGSDAALAAAIAAAAADPGWVAERGTRARALLESRWDRPLAVERWRALLAEACP